MAFDVIASSYQEITKKRSALTSVLVAGTSFGGLAVFSALVGILYTFHGRWIVAHSPVDGGNLVGLTLGHTLLITFALWAGIHVVRKTGEQRFLVRGVQGAAVGALGGAVLSLLPILMSQVKLRFIFVSLTPDLFEMLTSGLALTPGVAVLIGGGALSGLLGILVYGLPHAIRRPVVYALSSVVVVGMFQELIQLFIQAEALDRLREYFFSWDGLVPRGALTVAILTAVWVALWDSKREGLGVGFRALPSRRQKLLRVGSMGLLAIVVLIIFPLVAGNFIGQVYLTIGLFILMGMGLNLEIGVAGLLDMGFVAFFAVGAYVCALLTADSPYALAQYIEWFPVFNWWASLSVSVVCALLVGVLLGIPVLKIRGDYLAVATLATGEITRVVVLSDFAAPVLAGPQGIHNIPPPYLFNGTALEDPIQLYFVALGGAGIAAWIAFRLESSRLGRAWTAIRDDEDVAQALGVNLLNVKLLAYGLGAAFAGLAGAIFATMLKSIYPHSFQLLISINVLALIIVGGMGSLPGVVLGALVLIGLPELMREFGEYRFLFYGLAIIVVMRLRPAGLWPSKARRRERRLDAESKIAIQTELERQSEGNPNDG